MKLVVCLGNPGKEYDNTRHNIGFMFLDYYINKNNIKANWISKFNGLYFDINIDGEKVLFLKPQSYMNLSGTVVSKYVSYFKINIDDILVVCDDLDLSIGNFKLKSKGSSGGHNGLKNIEECLGTQDFKRLKIGISKNNSIDTKDYVLGKLSKEENNIINDTYEQLVEVLDNYFTCDFSYLMNKFNKKNR
ncbi:MAG: aminoacyl-tRNA hydrolase [Bacilli bacterium]|nr:aminoacyl-tRNA hydrolase [Bacilli bacterium]